MSRRNKSDIVHPAKALVVLGDAVVNKTAFATTTATAGRISLWTGTGMEPEPIGCTGEWMSSIAYWDGLIRRVPIISDTFYFDLFLYFVFIYFFF